MSSASSELLKDKNHKTLVWLVSILKRDEMALEFKRLLPTVKTFPECMCTAEVEPAVALMNLMKGKSVCRKIHLQQSAFGQEKNGKMQKIGTKQIQQITSASLTVALFAKKDRKTDELLMMLFIQRLLPVMFVNAGRYMQLVLDQKRHRKTSPLGFMFKPDVVEAAFLFCISFSL